MSNQQQSITIHITKANLAVEEVEVDLVNFTNARFYRVVKVSNRLTVGTDKEYLTLEIDNKIEHPEADIIIVAVDPIAVSQRVIWNDSVYLLTTQDTMGTLASFHRASIDKLRQTAERLRKLRKIPHEY